MECITVQVLFLIIIKKGIWWLEMIRIAIVGCTGKLGSAIMKDAVKSNDVEVGYAIARKGNAFVGKNISEIIGGRSDVIVIDDIELASNCDVYIDCTNAETFMSSSYSKYEKMKKPLIIATTAFSKDDIKKIKQLAINIPVFITRNFSVALHDFIETIQFFAKMRCLHLSIRHHQEHLLQMELLKCQSG